MKIIIRTTLIFCLMYHPVVLAGVDKQFILENPAIDESSGLAASSRYKNTLWTHNDSGNTPSIYAMDFKGGNLGSFFLDDVSNRDWEDMASFRWQQQDYLLLADSGDNYQMYLSSYLYIFREPEIKSLSSKGQYVEANGDSRSPEWSLEFTYEGGNLYDVEAVAVDIQEKKVILLTKRTKVVHVFELPLFPMQENYQEGSVLIAKKIAELTYLKNPTAMDISRNGNKAAILSYGRVYLFTKTARQSWAQSLKKVQKVVQYSGLYQPEAMCFADQEQGLFITSEKLPAKMLAIDLDN